MFLCFAVCKKISSLKRSFLVCDTPIINKVAKSMVALRVIHKSKMLKRVFALKACDAEVEMGLKDKEDP